MANRKRYDSMRHAMVQRLFLAIGLACAWMQGDASAKEGCDNLNYDESKVGDYTVPHPLLGKDGKRVTDRASWRDKRRNEILRDFRDLMYGHTPELPLKPRAEVVAIRKDAVDGLATRTIVKLHFFADLPLEQAADLLGLSARTAYRDWNYARAWLFRRLDGPS